MTCRAPLAGLALTVLVASGLGVGGARAQADAPAASAPNDANAGAAPITGQAVYQAFHEQAGVERVTGFLVQRYTHDPRIRDIFRAADNDHLKRMLAEQICYLIGGPCHYSGLDMKTAHKDMGLQQADFNAVVEDLQWAMDQEHVPVWAQNRLLAKPAPMERVVVTR